MEKNYDFRERLRHVHKADRVNPAVYTKIAGAVVDDTWQIVFPDDADTLIRNVAGDLQEYFEVSMGCYIKAVPQSRSTEGKRIALCGGLAGEKSAFRLICDGASITVQGADPRGIAQGCYYLEDRMNLNEGPVLQKCDIQKTPLYTPRMTHSGYGLDMYPEEYLRTLAHSGIDGILIFVRDLNTTDHGYMDFNDLIRRAADWGIDVYAYSKFHNLLHPDDEGAWEHYSSMYGTLFDKCPGLKGIVFVGESCEFPSKDPNTMGVTRFMNNRLPSVPGKCYPGWYPCCDFPQWVKMVRDIIREKNQDADIVFWTYNWNRKPKEARLTLIRNLPKDISLEATFEMGVRDRLTDKVTRGTADYTLSYVGPSDYFTSEAQEAAACGLKLYTMSNTGGATWDFGVIPYVPAPYRWKKRWDAMKYAHDNWNLRGLMESHHFGYWPSFIGELQKAHCWEPVEDFDILIRRIAVRDYGEGNADKVLRAWELISEGMGYYVATGYDQYGPFRIGPAYPLLIQNDVQIPAVPYAHFGGNRICRPLYRFDLENKPEQLEYELQQCRAMAERFCCGAELLREILPAVPLKKREESQRMWALAQFMHNSCLTAIHVKKWYQLKWKLGFRLNTESDSRTGVIDFREEIFRALSGAEREKIISEMETLAEAEMENARRTIPLVQMDSRLGYEPSMEYMCDEANLLWKIDTTQKVVQEELLPLLQK